MGNTNTGYRANKSQSNNPMMNRKAIKYTTKTGRKKKRVLQLLVREISGRGEGFTDETITNILNGYDKMYYDFSKSDPEDKELQLDKEQLVKELNEIADDLGDKFASGDKGKFTRACTDVNNKTAFVDLLVDFGLEIEITDSVEEENEQ